MQPFESHRPATLDEVLAVLGRSSSTKVLVGAHDLIPELPVGCFNGPCFISHRNRALASVDHRAHLMRVLAEHAGTSRERRAPR